MKFTPTKQVVQPEQPPLLPPPMGISRVKSFLVQNPQVLREGASSSDQLSSQFSSVTLGSRQLGHKPWRAAQGVSRASALQPNQMLKSDIKGAQKSSSHNNLVALQSSAALALPPALAPSLSKQVVAERTICYCSNFDLSLSEWVQMSSNLKDFRTNLLEQLGKHRRPSLYACAASNPALCRRAVARVVPGRGPAAPGAG